MWLADCYSGSRVWGPLANSGHGPAAVELSGSVVADYRAALRIADGDKRWAVALDTTEVPVTACLGHNCGSEANWLHVGRRNATAGTTAIAATADINDTDLGSVATVVFSRNASTSWVMEGFGG